jgi:phosphate transport system substrate-binding protein
VKKSVFLAAVLVCLLVVPGLAAEKAISVNGAGATFPFPVYSQWAFKYAQLSVVKINYQAIGSGGGIAQIKAKTVDYGGTDKPLKPEDMTKHGIFQFPMVMGGVVPIINVKGIGTDRLTLEGPTLANIFMGTITKWDDPAIKKLNPGLKLPKTAITVVHRTDGSGTTYIFTDYLSRVSPKWKEKVGRGKAVKWPAKAAVGGKGNAGVAGQTKNINGAIGYVEFAYAYMNKISTAKLKNQAGKVVSPDIDTFQAAAANADWTKAPPGFSLMMNNQPGEKSWPIVGVTWIMLYKDQKDAAKGKAMLKFFDWCYKNGGDMANKLHYVPMPNNVVDIVQAAWAKDIKAGGKALWP